MLSLPSLPPSPLLLGSLRRQDLCITRSSIMFKSAGQAGRPAEPRLRRADGGGRRGGGAGLMGALTLPYELRAPSPAAAAGTGADERTAGSGNGSGNEVAP